MSKKSKASKEAQQEAEGADTVQAKSLTPDIVDTDGNSVEVRVGYRLRPGVDTYFNEQDQEVPADELNHSDALWLMEFKPLFFRKNIIRGYHPVDSQYWAQ